ncbi:MAG TPA: DUF6265 family protein, partial [Pyrinomonadaceae bacterium]|nr:DUF6265 family protein [Pyrinomonadaceae bacterium]
MIERSATVLVLLLLSLATGRLAQQPTQKPVEKTGKKSVSLADIAWLTGCWEGRQGEAVIEEVWSKPGGASLLGFGRTVKGGRTTAFEFMQIREENGSLTYMPQPHGGARVSFPLKNSVAAKMTFENKEHDFPQRVTYERGGPELLIACHRG